MTFLTAEEAHRCNRYIYFCCIISDTVEAMTDASRHPPEAVSSPQETLFEGFPDLDLETLAATFEQPIKHVFALVSMWGTREDTLGAAITSVAGPRDRTVPTVVLRDSLLGLRSTSTPRRELTDHINRRLEARGRQAITEAAVSIQRTKRRDDDLFQLAEHHRHDPVIRLLRGRLGRLVHLDDLPAWIRALLEDNPDDNTPWGTNYDIARTLIALAIGPTRPTPQPLACGRPVIVPTDESTTDNNWLADRNLLDTPDTRNITLHDIVRAMLHPLRHGPTRRHTHTEFTAMLTELGVASRSASRLLDLLKDTTTTPAWAPRYIHVDDDSVYVFDTNDRATRATRDAARAALYAATANQQSTPAATSL